MNKLFVDSREKGHKLYGILEKNYDIEWLVLDAGDIIIPAKDNTNVLIEVMTAMDFLGKVKSQRLYDQIFKMKQVTTNFWLVIQDLWLVKKVSKWHDKSVISLIASVADNHKVFLSSNVMHTSYFIDYLYKKYSSGRAVNFSETRAKPREMSLQQQAIFSLSGISGIGETTAKKLLQMYGNIANLAQLQKGNFESCCNKKVSQHLFDVLHAEQ